MQAMGFVRSMVVKFHEVVVEKVALAMVLSGNMVLLATIVAVESAMELQVDMVEAELVMILEEVDTIVAVVMEVGLDAELVVKKKSRILWWGQRRRRRHCSMWRRRRACASYGVDDGGGHGGGYVAGGEHGVDYEGGGSGRNGSGSTGAISYGASGAHRMGYGSGERACERLQWWEQ